MNCPECNCIMLKRYENITLTSLPPQRPWYWWCGCGHTEKGGIEKGKREDEIYMSAWKKQNNMV